MFSTKAHVCMCQRIVIWIKHIPNMLDGHTLYFLWMLEYIFLHIIIIIVKWLLITIIIIKFIFLQTKKKIILYKTFMCIAGVIN